MATRRARYPGVRFRGDVVYYRVKLASGKWAELRFGRGTAKDAFLARQTRQKLEDKVRTGLVDPREAAIEQHAARPVGELLAEYHDHLRSKRNSKGHVANMMAFLRECVAVCGVGHVLAFDPQKVNRWLADLPLSARSRNYRRTAVLGFCRWAADYGRAPRNPVPSALVPKADEDADRRRLSSAMTEEQRDALFDALLDSQRTSSHCHTGAWCARRVMRRRAFYVLAANTGLRWAEIGRLRWGDIDVDAARVIVPAGQTKNGKQADLPLVGPVVDALRAMRPEDVGDGDRVFSGVPTLKTWKRDLQRAGIIGAKDEGYEDGRGRRLDRKCLRMSFCTWLKNAGVDLRDAQRLMRHSDPKLTSTVYTDIRLSGLRGAVEKLAPKTRPKRRRRRGTA